MQEGEAAERVSHPSCPRDSVTGSRPGGAGVRVPGVLPLCRGPFARLARSGARDCIHLFCRLRQQIGPGVGLFLCQSHIAVCEFPPWFHWPQVACHSLNVSSGIYLIFLNNRLLLLFSFLVCGEGGIRLHLLKWRFTLYGGLSRGPPPAHAFHPHSRTIAVE